MNQKQANDLIALLNYRDATIATLTAALEEARGALEGIVNDIHDYERVNNLHPNPGKSECWQSVERARTALATINAALGRVKG